MVMLPEDQVGVNVYNVLSIQGEAVACFVLLAYPFWKQPVQDTEVDVYGLEFPTVVLQVPG
jgi:hypothetical protein